MFNCHDYRRVLMKLLYYVVPDNDGKTSKSTGLYGYWSKPWHLVNPKIAGKWMFIPLELIIIVFDPPPYDFPYLNSHLLWPPGGHLVTPQRRVHRWHQQMPLILHNKTVLKFKSNYTTLYNHIKNLPVVPPKAVAEVSE